MGQGRCEKHEVFNIKSFSSLVALAGELAFQHPDQLIIFTDSHDVYSGGCNESDLFTAYKSTVAANGGAPVIMGAEFGCWPPDPVCRIYSNFTKRRDRVLNAHGFNKSIYTRVFDSRGCSHCQKHHLYEQLNSGWLMGPASKVHKAAELWQQYHQLLRAETDQRSARHLMFMHPDLIGLDYTGQLVLNMGRFNAQAVNEVFRVEQNGIFNLETGRKQCFLHGSGSRGKDILADLQDRLDGLEPYD